MSSESLHLELVWRRLSRPKNKNKPCASTGWDKAWNRANLRAPGGDGIRNPEQIITHPAFRCTGRVLWSSCAPQAGWVPRPPIPGAVVELCVCFMPPTTS